MGDDADKYRKIAQLGLEFVNVAKVLNVNR